MVKNSKKDIFLVIDANSLMHRSFHALPPFATKDGTVVNAVYGFLSTLLKAVKDFSPRYVVAAFDLPGGTFRHETFKEYKATREKAAQELYDQFPIMKEVLEVMGISILQKEKYEADDIIGTVVQEKRPNANYIILTSDMDALQLVDDDTSVYRLRKGINDIVLFDEKGVKEKYGLTPNQIVDFKALRGDPSDNIPGVKGIGEKTAVELLQIFQTLDGIYEALEKNDSRFKPSVKTKLHEHKKEAYMSQTLARIVRDVPITIDTDDVTWESYDAQKTQKVFQKYEFKSLLNRLPTPESLAPEAKAKPVSKESKPVFRPHAETSAIYTLINSDADFKTFLKKLETQKAFAVDTETTGTDALQAKLLGISVAWETGEAYYLNIADHPKWLEDLKPVFENPNIQKFGHNIKYDYHVLREAGVNLEPLSFDSMIASYLIRPGIRQYSLDSMVFKELGYTMQPIEDLIGKGKTQITMDKVPVDQVSWYAAEDADFTHQLVDALQPQLKEHELEKLFHEIEMPLVHVLAGMEAAGVEIDSTFLSGMQKDMHKKITGLEKTIYKEAGHEFNINSPLQLKEILFDELGLSQEGLSKTKTGVSTAAAELEKLQGTHPIIDSIMEYREYAKLQSTYVTALPKLVNPKTGRVHTSYNQTIAATGRLSSSDPNLQNIPIRTALGNEIRKAFVAHKGNILLSADYSQVELRIVASLADDEKMMDAFKKGEDIHTRTAAFMFDVPIDQVTKDMRSSAKEVNFGVLYGMGAWGLASRRKISREKARDFIERYFSVYEGVYNFLEHTRVTAQEQGYVETLMGRKRYLPEIYSGMRQVRASAERMAVNFPVQGTAADILKIAMIEIYKKLPEVSLKSRMILQVHDELVFEVPEADAEKVARFVKKEMESVAKLKVPLITDVSRGANWGDMEKFAL
ncbi:MAG: DNA polymerase I [Patescibacteria group bacterium]